MAVPDEVDDVLLLVFVDPELAVALLPMLPVRPLDVRLALEDHDEGSDADLRNQFVNTLLGLHLSTRWLFWLGK